jgi:hypothetical protein
LKRRALAIAVVFALAWLVVLLAAADYPPPVGFLGLLPFLELASALVYWRAIVYASWKARSQPRSTLRAIAEGALSGLAFAALIRFLPWVGEPSISPSAASFFVWLAVVAALGSFSAVFVYLLSGGYASGAQPARRSGGV